MITEKIRLSVTATGNTMEVVVYSKRPEAIEVVLAKACTACAARSRPTAWARPTWAA